MKGLGNSCEKRSSIPSSIQLSKSSDEQSWPFLKISMDTKINSKPSSLSISSGSANLAPHFSRSYPLCFGYIYKHSYLSNRQLQFIDLLRNFILEKGELQKRNLIEPPFTLIHRQGIRGVFSPAEIDEILLFTEKLIAA